MGQFCWTESKSNHGCRSWGLVVWDNKIYLKKLNLSFVVYWELFWPQGSSSATSQQVERQQQHIYVWILTINVWRYWLVESRMNQGCESGPACQLSDLILLFWYLSIGLDPDETLNGDWGPDIWAWACALSKCQWFNLIATNIGPYDSVSTKAKDGGGGMRSLNVV